MVSNRLNVKVENATVKGGDFVIGTVEIVVGEAISKDLSIEVQLSGREKTTFTETVTHQPPPTTHVTTTAGPPGSAHPGATSVHTHASPAHTHTQVISDKNSCLDSLS